MNKTVTLLLSFLLASALVGCGGGGGGEPAPVAVVTQPTTLPASSTTTAAVAAVPFVFPAGVPDLGTTAATSITFTSTAATPAFSIASGGNTATGTTSFGSCIFEITDSTFPAGHRLAATTPPAPPNRITINPCNIKVETAGVSVDAPAEERSVALLLGTAASTGAAVTVDVNPGGQLTINGKSAGEVTIVFVTGT